MRCNPVADDGIRDGNESNRGRMTRVLWQIDTKRVRLQNAVKTSRQRWYLRWKWIELTEIYSIVVADRYKASVITKCWEIQLATMVLAIEMNWIDGEILDCCDRSIQSECDGTAIQSAMMVWAMEMNQIDGDVLDRCDESKQVSAITKCSAIQSAMMVRAMALIPSVGEVLGGSLRSVDWLRSIDWWRLIGLNAKYWINRLQ